MVYLRNDGCLKHGISESKRNIWLAHERLTNQLNSAQYLRQNNFTRTLYVHPQILRIAIQIMIYALI